VGDSGHPCESVTIRRRDGVKDAAKDLFEK
jgi:hypothetical protein